MLICIAELRLHWASLFLLSSKKACMNLVFEGGYTSGNTNSISFATWNMIQLKSANASENTNISFFFLLKESIRKELSSFIHRMKLVLGL